MSSPLPSNMALTTVRGRYGTWVTVPDQPEPQFTPFVGMRVIFSPAYPFITNTSATPSPVVVATAPRWFQTDSAGYMSDPAAGFNGSGIGNNRNCQIVSSDDPDIYPRDWKYLVTFTGPGAMNFRSFRTPAPAGATMDMAVITPQRVASGSTPSTAEIAAANAAASAAAAQAAVASINRGQAGGVAPLDADGDVNDADGNKILGGGGGGVGSFADLDDVSSLAVSFNSDIWSTADEMRTVIGAGTGNSNLAIGTTTGTVPDAALTNTALAARALDSAVVHLNGDESIDGSKIFLDPVGVAPAVASGQAVTLAQLNNATGAFTNYSTIAGLPGYPATFPPTLPIAQSGITGLVTDLGALDTRLDAVEAVNFASVPWLLGTTDGVYPPRPATTRAVWFMDPNVQPTSNGVVTGGGGMVPDGTLPGGLMDLWIS